MGPVAGSTGGDGVTLHQVGVSLQGGGGQGGVYRRGGGRVLGPIGGVVWGVGAVRVVVCGRGGGGGG